MKIIHCADIHLDSRLEANLPTDKSRERKREVVKSFLDMIDYAKNIEAAAVIIAGDLFDTDRMTPTTRDLVLGKIADCKEVDFLYLCGNHDAGKALANEILPCNLKLFGDTWNQFLYENVAITGVKLTSENCRHIYGSLSLEKDRFNIVTMHGQLSTSFGEELVNRNELSLKGVDYLALGHYHKHDSGDLGNGVWCYSGSLEGRGFDECGDKGFVVLDIDSNGDFGFEFVKSSKRGVFEVNCDISGVSDTAEMLRRIDRSVDEIPEDSMVKVVLVGSIPQNARKDNEFFLKHLNEKFWFAKLKDKTRIELRAEEYMNDISLKGEFIRQVQSAGLSEEMRDRIIECGLAALSGQEVQ